MKRRKKRTVFTEDTVAELNAEFDIDTNPNYLRVAEISAKVGYLALTSDALPKLRH